MLCTHKEMFVRRICAPFRLRLAARNLDAPKANAPPCGAGEYAHYTCYTFFAQCSPRAHVQMRNIFAHMKPYNFDRCLHACTGTQNIHRSRGGRSIILEALVSQHSKQQQKANKQPTSMLTLRGDFACQLVKSTLSRE